MINYNIAMFRKEGEILSSEKAEELSDKLSPILTKFRDKFSILIHKFETGLDEVERIYFRRNIIYSMLQEYNEWKTYGDCIPDYVKIGQNVSLSERSIKKQKVILLTIAEDVFTISDLIKKQEEKEENIDEMCDEIAELGI